MTAPSAQRRPLCVVAGAGPGIGQAVARRFAREGFAVALLARRAETTLAAVEALRSGGTNAEGFVVDLANAADIKRTFTSIRATMGDAQVLVYNAAHWRAGPALDISAATFAEDISIGVTGALVCTQEVFPAMQSARRGTLLYTGGGLALNPQFGKEVAALAAAKAALRAWAIAFHAEQSGTGVRVGTVTIAGMVAPGTAFDPDRIANAYWLMHMHSSPPVETVFRGEPW